MKILLLIINLIWLLLSIIVFDKFDNELGNLEYKLNKSRKAYIEAMSRFNTHYINNKIYIMERNFKKGGN